ncbi:RNA polymerase factor sigma-54 [Geomicrobium sp. JSM 1781026]|uniref:RNA polymerase factor sigma-54 n=1 Tax=Geomicrobium sp. JSM 1781026 TaxID=3344580 RepID=UPI0035BF9A69
MNLEMGLFQQQTMKLVMTQQLRQAISLLQYSSLELSEYIEEQALENPLLEVIDSKRDEPIAYDAPVMWQDREDGGGEVRERDSYLEQIKASGEELTTMLFDQLQHQDVSTQVYDQVTYLIYNVDEQGYLRIGDWNGASEVGMSETDYANALYILQGFEPVGIGARSLAESLLLQLQSLPEEHALSEVIVEHHLQTFAEKKWKRLSEELGVTLQELQSVQDCISSLKPWPAQGVGGESPKFISPDVYVEWQDGRWAVQLNDESLPRIRMNKQYRNLLEKKNQSDQEAVEYAHQKYKQLVWLLKSIDQRQQTVRLVTEAIVDFQQEFLSSGNLKPMTLRDVAERADVHESTVSRTTTAKYMQTPKGCFELKAFFSKGLANTGGDETSSTVLKQAIRQWINEEDKMKPLSDQKITDRFHTEQGVKVSRRAVAKYRDELKIPASSKRKRFA